MEWFAWSGFVCFWLLYIMALVTLGVITFRKGRWVLGIIGIFFPLLWIIGALLPARPGSVADVEERDYYWWG